MTEKFSHIARRKLELHAEGFDYSKSDRHVKTLIAYAAGRFHDYEAERNKLLRLSISLVGLSGVTIGLLVADQLKEMPLTRTFLSLTIFTTLIMSSFVIYTFLQGTKLNYTHRKIADVKGWFFKYTINSKVSGCLVEGASREAGLLRENFEEYAQNMSSYLTSDLDMLSDDIQQLYILYIFQNISSNNHSSMMKTLRFFVPLILVFLMFSFCLAYLGR